MLLLIFLIPTGETVVVASFNIQDFGQAKMAKPEVVSILAETVRQFDIVAIQEISDKSRQTLPAFLREVNSFGPPYYSYTIGPRLGTTSKEQYAYFYREGILLITNFTAKGSFERPPYIACFVKDETDFCLATIHTPPPDAVGEIRELEKVATGLSTLDSDWLILGDFNADCDYASEEGLGLQDYSWLVPSTADTTVSKTDCAYDRIVSSPTIKVKRWGIYHFDREFGLNYTQAREVSDHYPVWVEFLT